MVRKERLASAGWEESLVLRPTLGIFLEIPGWGGRWEIWVRARKRRVVLSSGVVEIRSPHTFARVVRKKLGGARPANHMTEGRPTAQNRS